MLWHATFCFIYGVLQILIAEDGLGTGCQNVVVAVSPKETCARCTTFDRKGGKSFGRWVYLQGEKNDLQ